MHSQLAVVPETDILSIYYRAMLSSAVGAVTECPSIRLSQVRLVLRKQANAGSRIQRHADYSLLYDISETV